MPAPTPPPRRGRTVRKKKPYIAGDPTRTRAGDKRAASKLRLKRKAGSRRPPAKKKNPPKGRPKVSKPWSIMDPLAQDQVEKTAIAQAKAQIQPELDDIALGGREALSAHQTREAQQGGWYNNMQSNLDKAFVDTSSALNQMIALNNQGGVQNQQALQAALQAGNKPVGDAAAMMGPNTPAPNTAEQEIMAAALANAEAQRQFTGATAMGALQGQGERRNVASIGRAQAGREEQSRYGTQRQELEARRRMAMNKLGDLVSESRNDVIDRELKKRGQGFQEKLAESELGLSKQELALKKRNQGFQEKLAGQEMSFKQRAQTHQEKVDWANVGISQSQVAAQMAQIAADADNARTGEGKERAKLRAESWNRGLDMLSNYLTPGKGEAPIGFEGPLVDPDAEGEKQAPTRYRREYNTAYRKLTQQGRMSKSDALRMLAASEFPSWRSRARRELSNLKKRGNRKTESKRHTKKTLNQVNRAIGK